LDLKQDSGPDPLAAEQSTEKTPGAFILFEVKEDVLGPGLEIHGAAGAGFCDFPQA